MSEQKDNMSHYDNKSNKFVNPWESFVQHSSTAPFTLMRDWNSVKFPEESELPPVMSCDWDRIRNPNPEQICATWIGHASFLIQFQGVVVLTDPIWSERCSALQIVGPKRFRPTPCSIEELLKVIPSIDIVIISHNHYDHLDTNTVSALSDNVKHWFVPLGVKSWFKSYSCYQNVQELDWWEYNEISELNAKVICTPCQHFSGRTPWDNSKTLWCSWVIQSNEKSFYFAGDTGYRSIPRGVNLEEERELWKTLPKCPAFKEIGDSYGPFDLACIPIGAYSPRWFMSPVHLSPEDAVCVHQDVRSKQSIGMHWGTFTLTDEPVWEPAQRLYAELESTGIPESSFIIMKHGETKQFNYM